jgi:hypothetical protein
MVARIYRGRTDLALTTSRLEFALCRGAISAPLSTGPQASPIERRRGEGVRAAESSYPNAWATLPAFLG